MYIKHIHYIHSTNSTHHAQTKAIGYPPTQFRLKFGDNLSEGPLLLYIQCTYRSCMRISSSFIDQIIDHALDLLLQFTQPDTVYFIYSRRTFSFNRMFQFTVGILTGNPFLDE